LQLTDGDFAEESQGEVLLDHLLGRRELAKETEDWQRMSATIDRFLGSIPDLLAGDVS